MWFKNLRLYRLSSDWSFTAERLQDLLAPHAYQRACSLEKQTVGWIPAREKSNLVHPVGRQMFLTLRTEKKLLPATVVRQFAIARAQEIEEKQGYKPGRKQMRAIKEQLSDELLPRAFSLYRDTRVWIDPIHHWLVIDTASTPRADEAIALLAKSINPLPCEKLHLSQPPSLTMTGWLAANEAPAPFTIDQDTELRATDLSRSTIRYVNHAVEAAEMQRHIQAGKQCTRLAMTWANRISFVLSDALEVKRIVPLALLTEDAIALQNHDEQSDIDMTLMTGELAKMLTDLINALSGEPRH